MTNIKRILLAFVLLVMATVPAFATVNIETTRVVYNCNGILVSYSYPFKVLADGDLQVIKTAAATSAETTLALNTDYTITGAGSSAGTVVLTAGSKCGSGYTLTILRNMAAIQGTDYVDGEAFSAESIENALDKVTMIQQQQRDETSRALKLPKTSTITDIALPNPSANAYIGWNTTASGLTNITVPVTSTAIQYEVDALVTYGGGTVYTQATIEAALAAIGTTNKVTLLLRPGNWVILTALAFPANVEVKIPNGAYFSGAGIGLITFAGNREIYPEWFGASTSSADNHDAILAAATCAYNSSGIPVKFSAGRFKTSPISFLGLKNTKLIGVGGSPWRVNTTLYGVSGGTGDVMLQFASTGNPMSAPEYATCVPLAVVKDIFLDVQGVSPGTSGINIGINGNMLSLQGVTVRQALTHGIQLEDGSYPCVLDNVESGYNGGHGLYIRGPMTTGNIFRYVEVRNNGLYGVLIEGGAQLAFESLFAQANAVGGLKIYYADYTGSPNYFLQMMSFDHFYTEANGTLDPADPLYEGNYSLVIASHSVTPGPYGSVSNVAFSNSAIENGTTGNCFNIDALAKYKFTNMRFGTGTKLIGTKVFDQDGLSHGGLGLGVMEAEAPLHVRSYSLAYTGAAAIARWDFPSSTEGYGPVQTFWALNDAVNYVSYANMGMKIVKHDAGLEVGKVKLVAKAIASSAAADRASIESIVGTTGGFLLVAAENIVNVTAASSATITLNIPAGVRILGCQFRVDTALTAGDTWNAAYSGGNTQTIIHEGAVAKNTKYDTPFDALNTAGTFTAQAAWAAPITTTTTNVVITPHAGGSFTAAGTIRAIVYYNAFTATAVAP